MKRRPVWGSCTQSKEPAPSVPSPFCRRAWQAWLEHARAFLARRHERLMRLGQFAKAFDEGHLVLGVVGLIDRLLLLLLQDGLVDGGNAAGLGLLGLGALERFPLEGALKVGQAHHLKFAFAIGIGHLQGFPQGGCQVTLTLLLFKVRGDGFAELLDAPADSLAECVLPLKSPFIGPAWCPDLQSHTLGHRG